MSKLVSQAARLLGVDEATLERMARDMDIEFPELRKYFDENVTDEGLDDTIAELEKQLQEVFNHGGSPNVRRGRGKS